MDAAMTRLGLVRMRGTDPAGRPGMAVFSADCRYRYLLTRRLTPDPVGRLMVMIGCNPSDASARVSDHTVNRACYFAGREGCAVLVIVNLFALVSTKPRGLLAVADPVGGAMADTVLEAQVRKPGALVVPAWGEVPAPLAFRAAQVSWWLLEWQVETRIFGRTRHGHPRHPCRLGNDVELYREGI